MVMVQVLRVLVVVHSLLSLIVCCIGTASVK